MRGTDITDKKRVYSVRNEGDFPELFTVDFVKLEDLKYGENPNQQAALYAAQRSYAVAERTGITSVRSDGKGKGGLSLTNFMDIARGMDCLKYFPVPAVAIMKHNIVSGFAKQAERRTLPEIYRLARDADRRSNYGGTVVVNVPLDMPTTDAVLELYPRHFVDVLAAPKYEEGTIAKLESVSKNMRIAKFAGIDILPKFAGDETHGMVSIKEMPTGRFGIQDLYLTSIKSAADLVLDPKVTDKTCEHVVERDPTQSELEDLLTAWWLNVSGARSNGIVIVRNGVLVSMGSGQVERVGAVEQAIVKGMQKAMDREGLSYDPLMGMQGWENLKDNPFKGASCSSDAFFPFRDAIDRLASVGVTAVIQPYGSLRDGEVIDAANEHRIAMPATLERCFGHF